MAIFLLVSSRSGRARKPRGSLLGGARSKESTCRRRGHRSCGFNPWVGKILERREQQPMPVFSPGKFHGQRSLLGYSPQGHKESDKSEHAAPTISFMRILPS